MAVFRREQPGHGCQEDAPATLAKPPKATHKPTTSHLLGRSEPPTSHPQATHMRPTCDPQATFKPRKMQLGALLAQPTGREMPSRARNDHPAELPPLASWSPERGGLPALAGLLVSHSCVLRLRFRPDDRVHHILGIVGLADGRRG